MYPKLINSWNLSCPKSQILDIRASPPQIATHTRIFVHHMTFFHPIAPPQTRTHMTRVLRRAFSTLLPPPQTRTQHLFTTPILRSNLCNQQGKKSATPPLDISQCKSMSRTVAALYAKTCQDLTDPSRQALSQEYTNANALTAMQNNEFFEDQMQQIKDSKDSKALPNALNADPAVLLPVEYQDNPAFQRLIDCFWRSAGWYCSDALGYTSQEAKNLSTTHRMIVWASAHEKGSHHDPRKMMGRQKKEKEGPPACFTITRTPNHTLFFSLLPPSLFHRIPQSKQMYTTMGW